MENYDLLMLVILVVATLFGAIKGFAWQVASIASITVSYIVAYRFRDPVAQTIHAEPPWNTFLAMLILYLGTSLVIWVAFRAISRSIDAWKLNSFDRHMGAVFGFLKGVLYCTLATLFAVSLLGPGLRDQIVSSRSGYYIAQILDRADPVIPEEWDTIVRPYFERFDEAFDQTGTYAERPSQMPWDPATLAGEAAERLGTSGLPSAIPSDELRAAAEPILGGNRTVLPLPGSSNTEGGFRLPENTDLRQLLPNEYFQQAQDPRQRPIPQPMR